MKMKLWKWKNISLLMILVVMLTGCGASKNSMDMAAPTEGAYEESYVTNDIYMTEDAVAEDTVASEESVDNGQGQNSQMTPAQSQRKLIKNVDLQVETEHFDELYATVNDKTESLGGYVENSHMYNGSSFYGGDNREASLTIRIPAENLDTFLAEVSTVSNVISRDDSVRDITLQYVDLESHKEALLVEQDRLLELLEQAETIEDIIALESRLSEVRYELESMESQLRTFDNQVSYSTVYLYIQEVTKLTPVKEQSIWEQISTGFTESLYGVGEGLLNFAIGLIIRLPYLLVWAVVIVIFILILKAIRRSTLRKKEAKLLMEQAKRLETMMPVEEAVQESAEPKKEE